VTPDAGATASSPFTFDNASAGNPTLTDGSATLSDPLAQNANPALPGTVSSTTTFTYSHTFTGDQSGTCTTHDNTATFTTNTTGTTGSASQSVKVCVGADLAVSKTATPSFTRTYNWSLAKSVDKTLVKQVGGNAVFNYTVNVNETGFTDSAWQVAGKITVANPNDWEDVSADISDVIDNGGNCNVTGGTGMTIPHGGSASLSYTCSYASAPSPAAFTNTATATWDKAAFFTPDASSQGTASGAFNTPTTRSSQTVNITDTFTNGTPSALGMLTATDVQPFAAKSFAYSRTVTIPQFGCVSYPNTATITETGQSAGQTVTVCGTAKTGARTVGFWQNKNG
jgi:hypothetical protein